MQPDGVIEIGTVQVVILIPLFLWMVFMVWWASSAVPRMLQDPRAGLFAVGLRGCAFMLVFTCGLGWFFVSVVSQLPRPEGLPLLFTIAFLGFLLIPLFARQELGFFMVRPDQRWILSVIWVTALLGSSVGILVSLILAA
jgi:hypothetical protein